MRLPKWIRGTDVVLVALAVAMLLVLPGLVSPRPSPEADPDEVVARVYRRALPGVVQIVDYARSADNLVQATLGSGLVVDLEGHVLTSRHVVQGAAAKSVRDLGVVLADGQRFRMDLVGEDPSHDLALLRVEAPREYLHPLALGDSSRLEVGQRVVAIGSPYGLGQSLTLGVVSFVGRRDGASDHPFGDGIIQTDAAINPGNSGGPLLDLDGEVVGINTAAMVREIGPLETGSVGVSFAVPAEVARRMVPEMISGELRTRPWLGVYVEDVPLSAADGQTRQSPGGVRLSRVLFGGSADAAGLRGAKLVEEPIGYETLVGLGDLIVAVDGATVGSGGDLAKHLADSGKRVGDKVTLGVVRGDEALEFTVRLRARDESRVGAI